MKKRQRIKMKVIVMTVKENVVKVTITAEIIVIK